MDQSDYYICFDKISKIFLSLVEKDLLLKNQVNNKWHEK